MMALLETFAAFSLASGVILTLLPEGSLRRTARLAIGLMMLLCWAKGLLSLLPDFPEAQGGSVLSANGSSRDSAAQHAVQVMQQQWEETP